MSDILRRFKLLPWREMLQIAALSSLSVGAVELLLEWGAAASPPIAKALGLLSSFPLGIFIPFTTAVGMGALAVYFFERRQQQFLLNRASLWALVFCLLLGVFLKSLLLSRFLISLSNCPIVGIAIGVFWKARPYWR
jgi:hypothetical protein